MKRSLVASLAFIIVLSAAIAIAAPPVGGPAEVEPGKLAFSAGYFYSQDKWKSNTLDNFDPKVESNTYFGQVSYGLAPGWDVYLRLGAIDAKLIQSDFDWKSNPQFFGGMGIHGTLFQYKPWNLAFGPMADFAYFSDWTDRATGPGGSLAIKMKNHYSMNVGFGFQYRPVSYITLYGGPFYHYETAKLDVKGNVGGTNVSDESNIHPDKSFGGRLGAQIPLTRNISIQLETQFRDYVSGGGWLTYHF